jgi:hypothetical protein
MDEDGRIRNELEGDDDIEKLEDHQPIQTHLENIDHD